MGETGALGSLSLPPPPAYTRMHARTTSVVNRPRISRAQQPPLEGTSHKRPLGQMPFSCDSCQACRNQLCLLQLPVPSLSLSVSLSRRLPSCAVSYLSPGAHIARESSCPSIQGAAGHGLRLLSPQWSPLSRPRFHRLSLPLLSFEM